MFINEWLTPTRACGMIAFSSAAASSVFAWISSRRKHLRQRLPAILATFNALMLADVIFNTRWVFHDYLERFARENGWYVGRERFQLVALAVTGSLVAVALVVSAVKLWGSRGAVVATWGALISATALLVELISLHSTDAVLYEKRGSVLIVAFLWLAGGLLNGVGIAWYAYHADATPFGPARSRSTEKQQQTSPAETS